MLAFLHGINHYRGGGADDLHPSAMLPQMAAYKKILQEHEEKLSRQAGVLTAIENDFRKLSKSATQLIGNDLDELTYRFYRNAWTKLPDFSQVKHEDEGKLPKKLFDISRRTRDEAFGFVYEGFLIVPQDGQFTFYLDSDDGWPSISITTTTSSLPESPAGLSGNGLQNQIRSPAARPGCLQSLEGGSQRAGHPLPAGNRRPIYRCRLGRVAEHHAFGRSGAP